METFYHEQDFQIRTYEIDKAKRATVVALTRLMHEAAMQNVIKLKLSVWDLEPYKVSWVLMRKKLWIDRLPMLGEHIRVHTTPAGFNRSFTYRDYFVYDSNNQRIAAASSTWLLMDTENRKMAPLPAFVKEFEQFMPAPEDCLPRPEGKVPTLEDIKWTVPFRVDWHDLDFNQHLSNLNYLQWMLEVMPKDFLESNTPLSMQLEYKSESMYHDRIISEAAPIDSTHILHRLRNEDNDQILATAISEWKTT
ncbi:MAG: hypothetical protein KDC34_17075 [Saprospiraceae bacterium]|nr:hypothetical protein [Saprospiraceae bacterium]